MLWLLGGNGQVKWGFAGVFQDSVTLSGEKLRIENRTASYFRMYLLKREKLGIMI